MAEALNGYCLNTATPGISNRKILRRALYECIKQLENHPEQPTIVLIELTFDLRQDLWMQTNTENNESNNSDNDSDFISVQLARSLEWWKVRRNRDVLDPVDKNIRNRQLSSLDRKYLKRWQQAKQYFYSPDAENIELNMDLINFTGFMKSNNIRYLIFRGNPVEQLGNDHIRNTFDDVLTKDTNIFNLNNFSFTQWCLDRKYEPIDSVDKPMIGHPSLEAHQAFGLFLADKLK